MPPESEDPSDNATESPLENPTDNPILFCQVPFLCCFDSEESFGPDGIPLHGALEAGGP